MADEAGVGRYRKTRGMRSFSRAKRKDSAAERKRKAREAEGRAYHGSDDIPKLVLVPDLPQVEPSQWLPSEPCGLRATEVARSFLTRFEAEKEAARVAALRVQWTLADAKQMLRDGYSLEHVVRFTGYAEFLLRKTADKEGTR